MSQKPAWRHHYIPEFYLKQWANAKGQLTQFSKPRGDNVVPKRVYPRQTGFVNKLNSLKGVPPEQADVYERAFFSPVDAAAADALAKIKREHFSFNFAERYSWARFILSLAFRHPDVIRAARDRFINDEMDVDEILDRSYRKKRQPGDPNTLQEYMLQHRDDPMIGKGVLDLIMDSIQNKRIIRSVMELRWGYTRLEIDAPALLTSDRPLVWSYGLEHPECEILMPIGPKAVFHACASIKTEMLIRRLGGHALSRYINNQVVRGARQYVYGLSDLHLPFVQEYMGVNPHKTIPDVMLENMINGRPMQKRMKVPRINNSRR